MRECKGDGKAVREARMIHSSVPGNIGKYDKGTGNVGFHVILGNQAFRTYPDKIMGNHL